MANSWRCYLIAPEATVLQATPITWRLLIECRVENRCPNRLNSPLWRRIATFAESRSSDF